MTPKTIIRIQQTNPGHFWVKAGHTSRLCATYSEAKALAREWQVERGGFSQAVIHNHVGDGK